MDYFVKATLCSWVVSIASTVTSFVFSGGKGEKVPGVVALFIISALFVSVGLSVSCLIYEIWRF